MCAHRHHGPRRIHHEAASHVSHARQINIRTLRCLLHDRTEATHKVGEIARSRRSAHRGHARAECSWNVPERSAIVVMASAVRGLATAAAHDGGGHGHGAPETRRWVRAGTSALELLGKLPDHARIQARRNVPLGTRVAANVCMAVVSPGAHASRARVRAHTRVTRGVAADGLLYAHHVGAAPLAAAHHEGAGAPRARVVVVVVASCADVTCVRVLLQPWLVNDPTPLPAYRDTFVSTQDRAVRGRARARLDATSDCNDENPLHRSPPRTRCGRWRRTRTSRVTRLMRGDWARGSLVEAEESVFLIR